MLQLIVPLLAALLAFAGADVQRKTPAQHAQAGWAALHAGKPQEAAAAFEDALRGAPREPSVLLGAGIAANLLGQTDAARRYLLDALKYEPALTAASQLLGNILYRANDLAGAIDVYEKALAHAPDDRQLQEKLEGWRKERAVEERFGQKLTDHFTVRFEGPAEAELAQKAVEILEAAFWRIGGVLNTNPADVIVVVLYTREQFRDITNSPVWAGGSFDGRIRVPVRGALQNLREFERVLTHELTHAFVRTLTRQLPVWLNEGLAMYFDGTDINDRRKFLQNNELRLPFARLERPFTGLDPHAARLAYAMSAVAVEMLIADAGAPAIVGILTDIGRGVPFAEAFERHTNIPYGEFQKRMAGL